MEPLRTAPLHFWDSHKTTRSWRWIPLDVSWVTLRYALFVLQRKPSYTYRHNNTVTHACVSLLQAKVVDPDSGEIVPLGVPGELMIRGSCVMHGYWDDPEKTREVISPDRWYRTGWDTICTMYTECLSTREITKACNWNGLMLTCYFFFYTVTRPVWTVWDTAALKDAWRTWSSEEGRTSTPLR